VIHSALVNILDNALDACLEDKSKPSHQITFGVNASENSIHFSVEDNGIGMDKATLAKLFTLFFSSKGVKGTGLGLFISKRVIEQHGGHIDVTSEPEKGTRFYIRVPKVRKV
jgi:signal transduction histidine kinase